MIFNSATTATQYKKTCISFFIHSVFYFSLVCVVFVHREEYVFHILFYVCAQRVVTMERENVPGSKVAIDLCIGNEREKRHKARAHTHTEMNTTIYTAYEIDDRMLRTHHRIFSFALHLFAGLFVAFGKMNASS